MAIPLTGQNVPGGGAAFATDNLALDGGRVQIVKAFWGPDGILHPVDDAPGLRLPVKAVSCGPSDEDVKTGEVALNASRVTIVGGATVTELSIDNAPYQVGAQGGAPQHFFVDETGAFPGVSQGSAGISRMSRYRLLYVTAPPRNSTVRNNVTLTTTAEVPLIGAGLASEFHDLAFLGVYTDDITAPVSVCRKVLFRDAAGGPVRFTVPLSEKGGSNISFGMRYTQVSPASVWTAALSTATPAGSSVFVHVLAERRLT